MTLKPNLALGLNYSKVRYKGIGTSVNSWKKQKYTPKIITPKQYVEIRREFVKHIEKNRRVFYHTLLDIGRYSGMRLGEVLRLKKSDVYWNENCLIIREQKNGRRRDVQPVPKILVKQLKKHVEYYSDCINENDGYIFFSKKKNRLNINCSAVDMTFNRIRKRSDSFIMSETYGKSHDGRKLHVVSFHTLRHLYITEAVGKIGLHAGKSLARHDSLSSTLRYTHIGYEEKSQYIAQMYG